MSNDASGTTLGRGPSLGSYPKIFFEKTILNPEGERVFVAMPFGSLHSKPMWRVFRRACSINSLKPIRADTVRYPRPILQQILEEIGRAGIIIADLTDLNPNVLYELGIAHCRCEDVILIARKGVSLPFDLAALRCIFYDPLAARWQASLTAELSETLTEIRRGRPPVIIDDRLERTRRIVADLETLGKLPDEDLSNETVWSSSFMSSIAISDDEDHTDSAYHPYLLKERDALLALARRGCRLRFIVTPPSEANIARPWIKHGLQRTATLLKFLRQEDAAHENIDWVVSPMRQKNIYVIGRVSCIEGFKEHLQRGYQLTIRQTAWDAIEVNVRLLATLFARLVKSTLAENQESSRSDRVALRLATIKVLERSLSFMEKLPDSGSNIP
jgi:hypothetical protein